MKLWKYCLLIVSVGMLMLSSGVVSAVTETINDDENDVYHIDSTLPPGSAMEQNIGDKPNVDIKKISCVIDNDKLTLTIEVVSDGTILTDVGYSYNLQARTSDGGIYSLMIAYGEAGGMGLGPATPMEGPAPEPQISGNIFTMEWVFQADATVSDLAGDASYSPSETSIYRDIAPDSDNGDSGDDDDDTGDDDTGDDDTGDDADEDDDSDDEPSTPGFEAVAVIAAIGVVFILLERRRK